MYRELIKFQGWNNCYIFAFEPHQSWPSSLFLHGCSRPDSCPQQETPLWVERLWRLRQLRQPQSQKGITHLTKLSRKSPLSQDRSNKLLLFFLTLSLLKLKKHLVKSVISNTKGPEALRELGSSLNLLPFEKLDDIPPKDLKKVLKEAVKNQRSNVRWKRRLLRALVKKLLGDNKVSLQDC